MKKRLVFSLIYLLPLSLFAQIKINSSGNTYMKGNATLFANEGDEQSGTSILSAGDTSGSTSIGFQFRSQNSGNAVNGIYISPSGAVGIHSDSIPSGYGFHLYSGKAKISYNYNYYAALNFDVVHMDPRIFSNTGKVVFYTSGDNVFNDIQVKTCYEYSDENAKKDITYITNALQKIKELQGINFKWIKNNIVLSDGEERSNAGFLAQEVEEVIPEAVITNSDSNMLVSYTSIIPYIVEAMKEQQNQIDELDSLLTEALNAGLKSATLDSKDEVSTLSFETELYQNVPNPFSENTVISYQIAKDVTEATLYIYDMNGKQIKKYTINQRGSLSTTINGSELEAGMYLYSLITDGQIIDTKRMILTD